MCVHDTHCNCIFFIYFIYKQVHGDDKKQTNAVYKVKIGLCNTQDKNKEVYAVTLYEYISNIAYKDPSTLNAET